LQQYPSIAGQFERAVPARPWVKTGRLQYSNKRCIGNRFWITPHAACAVDALYSRGMLNAFQSIQTGCRLVVDALRTDDFSLDRFEPLDELIRNSLQVQDTVVYGSYSALRDPALVERWLVVWSLLEGLSSERVVPALMEYATSNSLDSLDFDRHSPATCINAQEVVLPLLSRFASIMERMDRDEITTQQAISAMDQVFDVLHKAHGVDAKAVARALADVTVAHARPTLSSNLERVGLGNY